MMDTTDSITVDTQARLALGGEDIATYSLARLGLSQEFRDINVPGNHDKCRAAVARLFTFTRADIDEYIARNALVPEQWYAQEEGSRDGAYALRDADRWKYYEQERGSAYRWATFDSVDEFRRHLINERLPPWLSHLKAPCRAVSGTIREVCPEESRGGEGERATAKSASARTTLSRVARAAWITGAIVWVAGFGYDAMFAGIPYQDPTEELAARYAMHAEIAGVLYRTGLVVAAVGVALWVVARVTRRRHPKT